MSKFLFRKALQAGLCAALTVSSAAGAAGKPDWVEQGRHGKPDPHLKHDREHAPRSDSQSMRVVTASSVSVSIRIGGYFTEPQRLVVREYYEPRMKADKCPPGLKKKNNGCLPPGQDRAWTRGQPLPAAVVYYLLPPAIELRLGVPPAGHKFVRVASDILLLAVGTSLVIDAIEDLGRL